MKEIHTQESGWDIVVHGPEKPMGRLISRILLAVPYLFLRIIWRFHGRQNAVKQRRLEMAAMFQRQCELAGTTPDQLEEIRQRVINAISNRWTSPSLLLPDGGPELRPDDMGYGENWPMPESSVEPVEQRLAREAKERQAWLESHPRPPVVDDSGLVWCLVPVEQKPKRKRTPKKRTRGKSHR